MRRLIKNIIPRFLINGYRNFFKKRQLDFYRGNKVLCPICNSQFNEFAVFGVDKRKNARCPNCGALERHRLLWKYLKEKTDLFNTEKKIRLLHFAPEKVFYDLFSANQNFEYCPCDLSPKRYDYAGKNTVTAVDIIKIPFEENYFDVVLCNHVLEHIPNDLLAMSELYRVIKKGGWAILQVPIDYSRNITYEDFSITTAKGREKAFGQNDHVRWYGRDYKDRLAKVGFSVLEDDFVKSFSPQDINKFGLIESELIYFCQK
jgi:SAM-dependent methyltransferase